MLRIDNTIFSLDILEKKFACDLRKCLGNCCRYGDAGAPLTPDEADKLNIIWPVVKSYLSPEGIGTIEKMGTSVRDIDGELVTPLIDDKECAYTIRDGSIYTCGIEKAWADGKFDYQKPLSCHLYPVRIKQFSDFRAVNYDQQDVCSAARVRGRREDILVYQFLKVPLIRALGEEMYDELCMAAREIKKQNKAGV